MRVCVMAKHGLCVAEPVCPQDHLDKLACQSGPSDN